VAAKLGQFKEVPLPLKKPRGSGRRVVRDLMSIDWVGAMGWVLP